MQSSKDTEYGWYTAHLQELFPIIICALYKNSKQHWNSAVGALMATIATESQEEFASQTVLQAINPRLNCRFVAASYEVHGLTFNVLKLLMEAQGLCLLKIKTS